jgi:hypothetical protein
MSQLKEGPEMKKSILTLLVAFTMAGLAVPVANAGQSQQAMIREKLGEIGAWAVPSRSTGPVASSGDGFDWNDAGLGVAFAFGIILVGTAGVVTIRRYHGPIAH